MSDLPAKLSEKYALIIMGLVTVIPPYTTLLSGFGGHDHHVSISINALFWAIFPSEVSFGGLQVLNLNALSFGIPLGFFNIIFAFQVIRFLRGDTSRRRTLLSGISTLVIPLASLIMALPFMLTWGIFVYIGPIPVQLVTGLILVYYFGPKEPTTPW